MTEARTSSRRALHRAKAVLPTGVKSGIGAGLRRYGLATAGLRTLPDFLIIGTKRGGTTSMMRYLLQHPAVLPTFPRAQEVKGVHYFDEHYRRGDAWYQSFFASAAYRRLLEQARGVPPVTGESSPNYLFHPLAAERARGVVPAAKVIVLLRDPTLRAYSHYRDSVARGFEDRTFEEALDLEAERLAPDIARMTSDPLEWGFGFDHFSYQARGRYAEQLDRWRTAYPQEQLLVLRSEDMYADAAGVFGQVLTFLGLPPVEGVRFDRFNGRSEAAPAPETVRRLDDYFADPVRELTELLGRDLGWSASQQQMKQKG